MEDFKNESLSLDLNELLQKFLNGTKDDDKFSNYVIKKNLIIIISYLLIVIVSLFGNLLVCYAIFSRKQITFIKTNVFIINLTLSNLMMTIFNIPLSVARLVLDNWPFGSFMCKLIPFVQVFYSYFIYLCIQFDKSIYKLKANTFRTQISLLKFHFSDFILIFFVYEKYIFEALDASQTHF